jgi:hypothetical protein
MSGLKDGNRDDLGGEAAKGRSQDKSIEQDGWQPLMPFSANTFLSS